MFFMNNSGTSIMVIAGEISGDMHAARLVKAIQLKHPDIHFFGIGGNELRKTGMEIFYDTRDMAVLGFTEVLLKIRFFRKVFRNMLNMARERKPDIILLVDYPGFNLRFAKKAHAMGLKIVYYICPQVWAWHQSRIPEMARNINRLITIFPFEKEIFQNSELSVDFVGHPLVTASSTQVTAMGAELPWKGEPYVALLPGSRYQEVKRILPVVWEAASIVEKHFPVASFIIAVPSDEVGQWVRNVLKPIRGGPVCWSIVVGRTQQVLRQARAAIVASGTATLEAAIMRCPMVVVYKVAFATYFFGRMLVNVSHLGMVNIVAEKSLCPELIQGDAKPLAIASSLEPLLRDGSERDQMLKGFEHVIQALGKGGGDDQAADIVLEVMKTLPAAR